jgi:hypothetical protein
MACDVWVIRYSLFANRDLRIANVCAIVAVIEIKRKVSMKSQDVVIALKLIAKKTGMNEASWVQNPWTQSQIAHELCMSSSEINAGLKRLRESGLLMHVAAEPKPSIKLTPFLEFLLHGIKYVFPVQLGGVTRGIVTSYAAPVFKDLIVFGEEAVPVWPYAQGGAKGLALEPLYPSVPKSVDEHPHNLFYDLLALVDAIRGGRARERNLAGELLMKKLGMEK